MSNLDQYKPHMHQMLLSDIKLKTNRLPYSAFAVLCGKSPDMLMFLLRELDDLALKITKDNLFAVESNGRKGDFTAFYFLLERESGIECLKAILQKNSELAVELGRELMVESHKDDDYGIKIREILQALLQSSHSKDLIRMLKIELTQLPCEFKDKAMEAKSTVPGREATIYNPNAFFPSSSSLPPGTGGASPVGSLEPG